jgi:AcrR family transcriptional regulator
MSPTSSRDARIKSKSALRRERQKEDLRNAILEAAGALFAEHGYEGFSLRQVAERIGYSPTTIYLHFADKDELLFEVVLDGFDRFGRMLQEAAAAPGDPFDRLEAIGRAYIRFGLDHPIHYRLMFLQRPEFLMRARPDHGPMIDSFAVLARVVDELLEEGAIPPGDPGSIAHLLWTGVHGIVSLAIRMPHCDDVQAERVADLYFPMLRRGLAA